MKKKSRKTSLVRIIASLALICTVVALCVSAVNLFTEKRIAELEEQTKNDAIKTIFSSADSIEPLDGSYGESVNAVYTVSSQGSLLGYSVDIVSTGFGGDIVLMVGINPEGEVCGVCITDHSETPGVGSKVDSKSFLDLFKAGNEFQAVSGATISSNAVRRGVNAAKEAVAPLTGGKEGDIL